MTPRPTKIALAATLTLTALAFAAVVREQRDATLAPEDVAPMLWLLTALFGVRVVGQVIVVLRGPHWLPPMVDWNLVPYRVLLPVQLVILGVMTWIDVSFSASSGPLVDGAALLGWAIVIFSALYAGAMVTRYVVRMSRRPEARWFGGTIPIVFHLVLATYLYALGGFHAGI